MKRKLLSAFALLLLLGTSKAVFAERAIPVYPEIKIEYTNEIQSADVASYNSSVSLLAESQNDGTERYGRTAIGKLDNGAELVKVYDTLVSGIRNFDETITVSTNFELTNTDAKLLTDAIVNDNPDLFWFGIYADNVSYFSISYKDPVLGGYTYEFRPDYSVNSTNAVLMKNQMKNQMETAADEFIKQANITDSMTDYDKALALHDIVCANLDYDNTQRKEWIHTAYGAFVKKLAVCDGYSKAYQYLLNKVGIDAHIATGRSRNEGHAWNLVKLDGEWYYTDVTWDDRGDELFYIYFNITTQQIEIDHTLDDTYYDMPTCNATKYNYFVMNKDKPWCITSSEDINDDFQSYLKSKIADSDYIRIYCSKDFIQGMLNKYQEVLSNYLHSCHNEIKQPIRAFSGYTFLEDEYHLSVEWFTNLYMNANNEMQFDGKSTEDIAFIQACYGKNGNLIYQNILNKKMSGKQETVIFGEALPESIKNSVTETKYMLWRGGTMQPICDMKVAP